MKKSGWKKKMRRGLAAACLAVGLTMAGWGCPGVDKAEAMLALPTASYSGSVTPNHQLNDVYIGFSYYLNTSGTNTEVFWIADSINADDTQNFTGNLYGDIDWARTIEYVVLGIYDNDNDLVTVGFDSTWATNNAIGHSWDSIFAYNYTESEIANALETGDTNTLEKFISDYFDFENRWADNGAASTLVKFSDGEAGGSVQATASPVPIPAAVWFLGSGLIGLVAVRRRKT